MLRPRNLFPILRAIREGFPLVSAPMSFDSLAIRYNHRVKLRIGQFRVASITLGLSLFKTRPEIRNIVERPTADASFLGHVSLFLLPSAFSESILPDGEMSTVWHRSDRP